MQDKALWFALLAERIDVRDLDAKCYGAELHVINRRDRSIIGLIHKGKPRSRQWACAGKQSTYYAPTKWQSALAMIRGEQAEMLGKSYV